MAFDAGSIFGKLKLDKSGFTQSVKAVNKDQKSMQTYASKSGVAFKGMWKQMAAGLGVTAGITMAVRGFIRQFSDMIEKGREFEREWANVTTMLSVSQGETDKLRAELQKLPPVLGDSTELAKGMYQVLSASVEPAKAIDVLTASAKAAKAGLTETNTAVDAITTVLNAYGMEAEEATNISDIMFMTVKRGKLTFGELAHSLGTVAPVAGTIGIKFDEVAAAIASLTRQGIPAATATMQLRQVMMAVLKPSEQAKKKAEELGIEWSAAALKAKGLGGFLAEVKEKTGGNSEALSKLVPNVRALTGVMALAGRAADGFEKDLGLMSNAAGSTDEAFKKNIDTFDTWLATAKVVSNKGKEAFYEGLINPIKEAVGSAEDLDAISIRLQESMRILGSTVGNVTVELVSLKGMMNATADTLLDRLLPATEKWESAQDKARRKGKEAKEQVMGFIAGLENLDVTYEDALKAWKKGDQYWKEWLVKMEKANQKLTTMEYVFGGLTQVALKNALAIREHEKQILADSKSAEEANRRIIEYRESLKKGNETIENSINIFKEFGLTTRTELKAELEAAEKALVELKNSTEATPGSVEKLKSKIKDLKEQLYGSSDALKDNKDKLQAWEEYLRQNNLKTTTEWYDEIVKLNKIKDELKSKLDSGKLSLDTYNSAIESLNSDLQILRESYISLNKQVEEFNRLMDLTDIPQSEIDALITSCGGLTSSMDILNGILYEHGEELGGVQEEWKKTKNEVTSAVQEMSTIIADSMRNIANTIVDTLGIYEAFTYQAQEFDNSYYENAQNNLDEWYENQQQIIENTIQSEEEKAAALQALEEKYYQKKQDLQNAETQAREKHRQDELKKEESLWNQIKGIVATAIEEIMVIYTTKFLMKILEGTKSATSAVAGIFDGIGAGASAATSAASGAASAMSGVFLGLGAAVGTFLGTLISGGDDLSYTNKLLETVAWDQGEKMDHTNAQLNDIKKTSWNINDKLGALYNAMTTQGTVYVNMFASDPLEQLGQDFNRGLTGLGGDIVSLGGKIGNGIAGLEKGIRDSNNKFIKSMKNFNEVSGAQGASMMGVRAISAQDEGTWYVQAQEQLFRAHRGEIVDIRHVDSQPTRAGSDGIGNINVQIKPVVIPKNDKYLINFTVEKVERLKKDIIKGNVPINLGAIAGGRL